MTGKLLLETKGVAAGRGTVSGGIMVLSTSAHREGAPFAGTDGGPGYVLFCNDISKEDMPLVQKASAVVALTGGLTCDAAVVARALGKPCVVSCPALSIRGASLLSEGATIHATSCLVEGDTGRITLYRDE